MTILSLLAILLHGDIAAAKSLFTYSKVDQLAGLSNNKVTAIAKDKDGLYWVGTRRGLNYIVNGRVEQWQDANIGSREIKFIYTDSLSQLWVATDSDLLLYDYARREFNRVAGGKNYSSANAVGSTSRDIVICRRDAIEIYDPATGIAQPLVIDGGEGLEYNTMRVLDGDNILLICSQGREIYRLNIATLELDLYDNIKLPVRTSNYRDRIFVDSQGRLWISIFNHSLVRYSLDGEGVKEAEFSTNKGSLSHNLVLDMFEYDGELLVATDGGGINSIDMLNDRQSPSTKLFSYREIPLSRSVNTLWVDANDGLFLGTIRDGLIGFYHTDIQTYSIGVHSDRNSRKLANVATLSFCEDGDRIWIATDGGGVWRYDVGTLDVAQLHSTKDLKVTDIAVIGDRTLLVSVYGDGIYRLDIASGAMTRVTIVDKECDKSIADKDLVVSFAKLDDSNVLILADNLYQYNSNRGVVSELQGRVKFATGNLFAADQNSENQYVHNQYTVYKVDRRSAAITQLYSASEGGISSVRVSEGCLWIVRNYSLYSYDLERHTEQLLMPSISGYILSAELDKRGNLWLTTFNSVVAMDISNPENYLRFDSAVGYAQDEYLARAAICSQSGDIYLGGTNGFITIDRDIPLLAESPKPIELLSVKVDEKVVEPRGATNRRVVTVPWNYNSIDLEIYAQNRNIHHINEFQYTITSDGKTSTFISDNRLSMQMPYQGKHQITAAYLNNNGEWCSPTELLEIVILPPWWNSTLFKLIITLMAIVVLIAVIILYNHNRGRKLMQEHMEREQELSNNKIQFLINISHELRTPLTLIYAPLKRLLENSHFEGDIKRSLVNIFGQTRYMAELINMVLDARRMEAGHGEIEIMKHNFNEWVRAIVEEFRDECAEHKIDLELLLDPAVATLNFDAPKCRTVLSNLLMNAIRYSKRDGSGRIRVVIERLNDKVRLSVVDNGVGLAGVDINSLFNRFVRVNNHSTGSGIGLSYSKTIIEQHRGGVIGAFCNNSEGATFFFELPIGLACSSQKIEAKPYLSNMLDLDDRSGEMTNQDYPLSQHTILIVEDQVELLDFLEDALARTFKRVYRARNGVEAYAAIKRHLPSIVVSDVMMPEMDGYELCAKVKNDIEVSHTPIVLLTAKAEASSKMLGYKSGADAYLTKPFDLQYLLSIVASQLRSRDITRSYYSKLTSAVKIEEVTYSNADEQFMLKLNGFINDNLASSIDVEIIAKHMCMSRAALYKKLKTIIDIGAMEYVTKIRMTIAAERLLSTSKSITEIAMQCGYTDNQYFSKAFKQYHGISPSQYRKLGVGAERMAEPI
ncbi:MAG: response regulator [Rikenellaceae bacterium]